MLEAFTRRLEADYDVGIQINDDEAQETIHRARKFRAAAEEYLAAEG